VCCQNAISALTAFISNLSANASVKVIGTGTTNVIVHGVLECNATFFNSQQKMSFSDSSYLLFNKHFCRNPGYECRQSRDSGLIKATGISGSQCPYYKKMRFIHHRQSICIAVALAAQNRSDERNKQTYELAVEAGSVCDRPTHLSGRSEMVSMVSV